MSQIFARRASTTKIMMSSAFKQGFDDARNGVQFDWRNDSWDYERGRHFAHIAPVDMSLRNGSKLNPKALALCQAAVVRKLII
jgi:hypothetical protein